MTCCTVAIAVHSDNPAPLTLFLFGVQLGDFDLKFVHSFTKGIHPICKHTGLDKQLSKDILCKPACDIKQMYKVSYSTIVHLILPKHTLTEGTELADDVRQCDVGHTLQLTPHWLGQGLTAQVPRLDIPHHQRHDDKSVTLLPENRKHHKRMNATFTSAVLLFPLHVSNPFFCSFFVDTAPTDLLVFPIAWPHVHIQLIYKTHPNCLMQSRTKTAVHRSF